MPTTLNITAQGIVRASKAINPDFLNSPMLGSVHLADLRTPPMVLKDETANAIRSFKGRGTDYYAHNLKKRNPRVVCASAGNFGQGLAVAMARRGGRAVVFAAKNANPIKVSRMQELGAQVIMAGQDFDDANAAAREFAEAGGLPFLEDSDNADVAIGAGTIAKEMTDGDAEFDAIYVPVGGGSLINGIGTWLAHARPGVPVIGVCATGAPSQARSWQKKAVVKTDLVDTFADGIAIRAPVSAAVEHMWKVVSDFVLVSDKEILSAMRSIYASTGLRLEPSGTAGVAAIAKDAHSRGVMQPATLLCGANVTDEDAASWYARN